MTWGIERGRVILTLRLATLSQVWDQVFRKYLASMPLPRIATKPANSGFIYAKAA